MYCDCVICCIQFRYNLNPKEVDVSLIHCIVGVMLCGNAKWFDQDDIKEDRDWKFGSWTHDIIQYVPCSQPVYWNEPGVVNANVNVTPDNVLKQICQYNQNVIAWIGKWKHMYPKRLELVNSLKDVRIRTLRQPWAQLTDLMIKNVENRMFETCNFKMDCHDSSKPPSGKYYCRACIDPRYKEDCPKCPLYNKKNEQSDNSNTK